MKVDRVWMSLPSYRDYYRDYPKAKLQKKLRDGLAAFVGEAGATVSPCIRRFSRYWKTT